MIIKIIRPSQEDTAVDQLPEPNMVVDPRPNNWAVSNFKFKVTIDGMTMTVTRTDTKDGDHGWWNSIKFRVYDQNDFWYSFLSSTYLLHGLEHEMAPRETTEAIVKDGAERIGYGAFSHCTSLSKVSIPNSVSEIDHVAFSNCASLRFIQLPPNLKYIGNVAFQDCSSLEAIYIPPNVIIDLWAFRSCKSLRIINFPDSMKKIDFAVITGCEGILTNEIRVAPVCEQTQWLRNRYNPLHNLCWDPSVTAEQIEKYIQEHHGNEERATTNDKPRFTALHLLAANPSVTAKMITTYLRLVPDVATMQDNIGETPLHMLCSAALFSESSGGAIRAYLYCSEGKKAAFMKDQTGRTPFDCLCEKSFDDMPFLENKSFADLVVWWSDCLDLNLFTSKIL